jgi:hypothetical protein
MARHRDSRSSGSRQAIHQAVALRRIAANIAKLPDYRTGPAELPERPFNHTQAVSDFVLGAAK